jgi:leucyl aminopeptidase
MQVIFSATRPADAAVLALPVEKDGLDRMPAGTLDDATLALVRGAARAGRFEGEAGAIAEIFVPGGEAANRILLLGVGSGSEADYERAGGALTARFLTSGVTAVTVDFAALGGAPTARAVARFAAAAVQRGWRHDVYRTKLADKQKPTLDTLTLANAPADSDSSWATLDAVTQGMELTRTLVSEPPNIIYPESFVERCRHLAELGVEITVLDRADMEKLGMGALLGVAQGSRREARLLAMRWNGKGSGDVDVALVGKGVTFDTGGISIKPAAGMEDMKWDMGGAGAVAGAMKALALRKAKANVIGVCGLVENMPDGNAQRPGDVVTSMSGQTIEVVNTDAEGRLVLCDVLTFAQREYNPAAIIDLATLTGAMIVSLGHEYGGLFANDEELAAKIEKAGKASGDKVWRFPMSKAYDKLIDSPIADMKNMGARFGGSITAAQFLQRFVEDSRPWAHLDIAGMVWADKPGATWDKGATGYGVRLLDTFVRQTLEG